MGNHPSGQHDSNKKDRIQKLEELPTDQERIEKAIEYAEKDRLALDVMFGLDDKDECTVEEEPRLAAPKCLWVRHEKMNPDSKRVMLYLHGGGMSWGKWDSIKKRGLAPKASRACNASVLFADYRLLPEARVEDAISDCFAAYKFIVETLKVAPENFGIIGESSGGYLSLMTLIRAKEAGLPMPGCAVLIAPDTDITLSGDSHQTQTQDNVSLEDMKYMAYLMTNFGKIDAREISPLYKNLEGFPPVFLQAGSIELSLSDTTRLGSQLRSVGVDVTMSIWKEKTHAWMLAHYDSDDSDDDSFKANCEYGEWVQKRIRG